jgi:Flp pilus assembly pilin Flp
MVGSEDRKMTDLTLRLSIRVREFAVRRFRGQTMTEYAMVLAAIAIAVFAAYKALGSSVSSLMTGVDSTVTNA